MKLIKESKNLHGRIDTIDISFPTNEPSKFERIKTKIYDNGDKYIGEFKEGKKTGQGIFTWANGDKYIGEYLNDKMNNSDNLNLDSSDEDYLCQNDEKIKIVNELKNYSDNKLKSFKKEDLLEYLKKLIDVIDNFKKEPKSKSDILPYLIKNDLQSLIGKIEEF